MSVDGWVEEPEYDTPTQTSSSYSKNNWNSSGRSQRNDRSDRYINDAGGRRDRNGDEYKTRDNRNNDNRNNSRGYGERNNGAFNDSSAESTVFEILPTKVGLVIGRGGAKIREIQEQFNVNVKVDRDSNSNGMAGVTIRGRGNPEDVNKAKDFIENLCAEQSGGGGGGGGRGSDNGGYGGNSSGGGGSRYSNFEKSSEPAAQSSKDDDFVPIDWQKLAKQSDEAAAIKWAQCPELLKNFYKENELIASLSEDEVALFRESNNNIQVSRAFKDQPLADVKIPNPIMEFEHCFTEYPDLLSEIKKQGFTKPSPIQCQAWPVLLKGEDLIGIAQTGTGKTLAFLLPAMIHTEYQPLPRGSARGGPNVLVMAPTRELALQIEKEVGKYKFRNMKAVCVYGGGDRNAQIEAVRRGVEIVIATPGRLNDLIADNIIDVTSITYLVLDEADRMLDMGFEPQIRKFLLNVRPDRQTIMTSATWPPGVRRLAERYMINPIQVCIGTLDLAAVHSVEQIVEIIDESNKYYRLMEFIQNMQPNEKVIIFCGKKARADDLSSEISLKGIAVQCIHGDRDQSDREQALADIKSGEVSILIATDVASRGIDIEDITHVINYDFPRNIEEYVHRVGRTGRAGRTGISLSFFTREDWGSAGELIDILQEANQEVPDELNDMKRRFEAMKLRRDNERSQFGGGGGGGRGRGGGGGGGGYRSGGGGGGGGGGGRRW